MKLLKDMVVVRVKSEYKKKLVHGSLELEVSESFAPYNADRHTFAQTYAEIVYVCASRTGGRPVEVEPGDKVYVHFNAISENSRLKWEDDKVHKVMYEHLFCKVKEDGEIVMLNERILCEPIFDDDVIDGVRMKNGLVVETGVKHDPKRAKVAHIAPNDLGVEPGDIIHYEKHADFENLIEGKIYFVMFQDDMMAVEK